MRKLAPVFILTSFVALSSGAAFAFGDMNKNKNAPTAANTSVAATSPAEKTYTAPTNPTIGSGVSASDTGKGGAGVAPSTMASNGADAGSSSMSNGTTANTASSMSNGAADGKHGTKWSAKDCAALQPTDAMYKQHGCTDTSATARTK